MLYSALLRVSSTMDVWNPPLCLLVMFVSYCNRVSSFWRNKYSSFLLLVNIVEHTRRAMLYKLNFFQIVFRLQFANYIIQMKLNYFFFQIGLLCKWCQKHKVQNTFVKSNWKTNYFSNRKLGHVTLSHARCDQLIAHAHKCLMLSIVSVNENKPYSIVLSLEAILISRPKFWPQPRQVDLVLGLGLEHLASAWPRSC